MMKQKITDYHFPEDLKTMTVPELELLAVQIREFLIDSVAKTGGHLSPNLGVVELTIALHRFFDSPRDKILFDVGHQSYVHKILTGRADQFDTLRQLGGLSGYPKRKESPHDFFDTGHTSTSLSLMAGLVAGRDLAGEDWRAAAVIGDGAMSGGLAYEALNNLGAMQAKCLVILNDNEMSIGKNGLALDEHLSKLRVSKGYSGFKKGLRSSLGRIPKVGDGLRTVKSAVKYALLENTMFEEMGFTYLGPVDGHDIDSLLTYLSLADGLEGPVIIHVLTKKGKGYKPAENNPTTYHGLSPFDPETGKSLKSGGPDTYPTVFGRTLMELAEQDERIVAISAAMIDGTGLKPFALKYPERTFDVGIAEGYAVSFAAGLAKAGRKPVVALYSTFLQRALDEVIVDVCINDLPVVFAIDRAGCVGEDGETHHGFFDVAYLTSLPNLTFMAPRDGEELSAMLKYALSSDGPCAIRYPKSAATTLALPRTPLQNGAQVLLTGADCEIWATGNMVATAGKAIEFLRAGGIDAGLVNPRFLKPFPREALIASAKRTKHIFCLEDNVAAGGFGEQAAALLSGTGIPVTTFAWPDEFVPQGSRDDLFAAYGLMPVQVAERIVRALER